MGKKRVLKSYFAYVKACRVVDGDTVEMRLDPGWGFEFETTGRIYGVDTPELGTSAGMAVKRLIEKLVADTLVDPVTGGLVQWVSIDVERPKDANDKFGRTLGTLKLPSRPGRATDTLTAYLIRHGLAVEYCGGKRRQWSPESLGEIQRKAEALLKAMQ